MLRVITKKRSITASLSALVLLSLWTSAMAGVFCPRMAGGRDCCMSSDRLHVQPEIAPQDDPASVGDIHTNHEQMPDMFMEDGSMHMPATQDPAAAESSNLDMRKVPPRRASDEEGTQQNELCSHCLMHSRSGDRFAASFVVSNLSNQIVSVDLLRASLNTVPAAVAIVELHDHGPPGPVAPLFILVSSFRI